jgi:hypothetical protein
LSSAYFLANFAASWSRFSSRWIKACLATCHLSS